MARVSNAKAKEKKQRIVLAIAGVLLLGLLAVQGPKFLKLMKGSSSAATATTTTTVARDCAGFDERAPVGRRREARTSSRR